MNQYILIAVAIAYLLFLFAVASFVDRRKFINLKNNPYAYTLTLAVYCSAWTFFGSVGRVSENGLDFLSIYLGPTLTMTAAWWLILKIKKISNYNRITSIADFLATRYGKSSTVGIIATLTCLIAAIPYVALQIKAISGALSGLSFGTTDTNVSFYLIILLIILLVFTLHFGSRNVKSDEQNEGLLAAVSVESLIKLVVFLVLGFYTTFVIFNGFDDLFAQNSLLESPIKFNIIDNPGYGSFLSHTFLAGGAFLFLPRQFEITFVAFKNEALLRKAVWLFPLYLFLINLFVIPLALSGNLISLAIPINSDAYVIAIPLLFKHKFLATVAFLGGFSAATGMIIMESTAIGKMLSNNVIFPIVLKNVHFKLNFNLAPLTYIRFFRQSSILLVFVLGYLYYATVGDLYSLTDIGLVAFSAIIQFLPAVLGGLYWEQANRKGVLFALVGGLFIWYIFLIHPVFVSANLLPDINVISTLTHAFTLPGLDLIGNVTVISLLVNSSLLIVISSFTKQRSEEKKAAQLFTNIEIYESVTHPAFSYDPVSLIKLQELFANFVGGEQAKRLISRFLHKNQITTFAGKVDSRVADYVERVLGGIVGNVSAKIIVSSIFTEQTVNVEEVIEILKESQSVINLNKELQKKSSQLEHLTQQLKESNEKLVRANHQKNEFLTTVTHEIRTPLTSIKALSEILIDNKDLSDEERDNFLTNIIREIQRMVRLVNQVLDLERYEAGNYILKKESTDLLLLIRELPLVKELLFSNKLDFTIFCDETAAYSFEADVDKIKQVIINLLTNAIKFTDKTQGLISLYLRKQDDKFEIIITDNGVGIPENALPRIFDKFYQADNQDIRKPVGSGLGLAVCKQIIELHEGSIHAENGVESGATFIIKLPAK